MGEMIERVAKAIEDSLFCTIFDAMRSDGGIGPYSSDWLDAARAAVEAMRDHSPMMENAGSLVCVGGEEGPIGNYAARQVWRDMIDAALEEEPQI